MISERLGKHSLPLFGTPNAQSSFRIPILSGYYGTSRRGRDSKEGKNLAFRGRR